MSSSGFPDYPLEEIQVVEEPQTIKAIFDPLRGLLLELLLERAASVQELAAAVQGIEARRNGEIRVKSLQDHARDLDLFRRHAVAGEEVS